MFARRFTKNFIRLYADKVIKTPYMADSITQGTLASWEKKIGQFVAQDELVANIETDKVTIPVNSPESGVLKEFFAKAGDTVEVGSNLFKIDIDAKAPPSAASAPPAMASVPSSSSKVDSEVKSSAPKEAPKKMEAAKPASAPKPYNSIGSVEPISFNGLDRNESREKMSRMRLRIAERMKEAQNTAASLTTFNEVDMSALMSLRSQFKDEFVEKHKVRLGFMSAFVKASAQVLMEIPAVNARIDSATQEVVYSDFVDISVAVATPKGLVTPVLRNCEGMSFAEIEREITEFGKKARENRIALEDLSSGTFTISNGGVFGSMMGTPILNSPQSAILGMHAIKDRPVVIDGEIKIRPMMYLALTYDHRVIDGREAVTFLVRIKKLLENPSRFLFGL